MEPLFGAQLFRKPMQATPHPTEPSAWWVGETEGRIVEARQGSEPTGEPPRVVLDIRDRVRAGKQWGLLSFALAPGFPEDPRLFVTYTAQARSRNAELQSRVSVFRTTDGGRTFDPETEEVLLAENQRHVWHPIAGLRFGPDGFLYVAWGEGSAGKSLVRERLLRGKVLRIDVSGEDERGYRIPEDNPFLAGAERPEVWATGFRNPWRFSFDPETGDLWIGDVGGREFEEVGRVRAGENHGWPAREGFLCRRPQMCAEFDAVEPLVVHSSSSVCAIIGGHVYRGKTIPSLVGKYVYGDHCAHALYAYDPSSGSTEFLQRLDMGALGAIELDRDGELVLVETDAADPAGLEPASRILRLVRTGEPDEGKFPYTTLEVLGCQDSDGPRAAPEGMIPYDVVVPAWDQGDEAVRFFDKRFRSILASDNGLSGRSKVYLKTLLVEDEPIETQVLAVDATGNVGAWSYAWDPKGGRARLVTKPETRRLWNGREWRFDTEPACLRCHSEAAGRILGTRFRQLDANGQLERWVKEGVLELRKETDALSKALERRRRLVDPGDATGNLDDRARSYLHVRCGSCHRPGGAGAGSPMNLTLDVSLAEMKICGASPMAQHPGSLADAIVQPGAPERSLLYLRMMDEGSLAMPPGRMARDTEGAELIGTWIRGLKTCTEPPIGGTFVAHRSFA